MEVEAEEDREALEAALQMSLGSEGAVPAAIAEIGTGLYELSALVTHKGRSADSGHYKAYVRAKMGEPIWRCFDDATVSEVSTEDVLKLCGSSGDSDMAYLCFYNRKA